MTLQQCKDEVAKKRGFESWNDYRDRSPNVFNHSFGFDLHTAAELYAEVNAKEVTKELDWYKAENERLKSELNRYQKDYHKRTGGPVNPPRHYPG